MLKITIISASLAFFTLNCTGRGEGPAKAVKTFWAAMARSDNDAVLKTQIYYEEGMTAEYIATPKNIEWLFLDSMETDYENAERARVYYQVVFKKKGQTRITRYRTGTMAIKRNGHWLVGRPVGARPKADHRQ